MRFFCAWLCRTFNVIFMSRPEWQWKNTTKCIHPLYLLQLHAKLFREAWIYFQWNVETFYLFHLSLPPYKKKIFDTVSVHNSKYLDGQSRDFPRRVENVITGMTRVYFLLWHHYLLYPSERSHLHGCFAIIGVDITETESLQRSWYDGARMGTCHKNY